MTKPPNKLYRGNPDLGIRETRLHNQRRQVIAAEVKVND